MTGMELMDLERAKQRLEEDDACCVLVHNDQIIERHTHGVRPLLELLDQQADLKGFAAADKVVGRAAASLYVLLGVTSVYGETMSMAGQAMLEEHGIASSCGTLVQQIMNRSRTGICPMEAAVARMEDVSKAPELLKAAIMKMRQGH